MALGQVDYGLYGVVGGLSAFMMFFNDILATSVGRFYAFSVGRAQLGDENERTGLGDCQKWFTVAVVLHTALAFMVLTAGEAIGEWAVRDYLTMPADRVQNCLWVWRIVCLTCAIGILTVPVNAMYKAKQYIAELTIYSFVTTTLNALFLYYMVSHPGDWLVRYALWTNTLIILPHLIIAARGMCIFSECRITRDGVTRSSFLKLLSFSGWNFFGAVGKTFKGPGIAVLVNKMLGPSKNAAVTIANSLAGHTETFATALVAAFAPAITNARGAEDFSRMQKLMHAACKFGTLLVLPFAIPLVIEVDEVLRLWLKDPPEGSSSLCVALIFVLICEKLCTGHWIAISANGKIAKYQIIVGVLFVLTLPIAGFLMLFGLGVLSVGIALIVTIVVISWVRIVMAKRLLGISPLYWLRRILMPITLIGLATGIVGYLPQTIMQQSFIRVVVTTILSELTLMPLAWLCVLDTDERCYAREKLRGLGRKLYA